MPKYTENLNLFEYDVEKDGKNTYNISQCLNDNWDKIDSALGNVANLTTEQKANFVSAINEIVSNLDKKSSIDLNNLSALGQSILDRKVEVEALLQQNGYAKFSWKEDNKISILLSWGYYSMTSSSTINYPITFNNALFALATTCCSTYKTHTGMSGIYIDNQKITNSSLYIITDWTTTNMTTGVFWFVIGY